VSKLWLPAVCCVLAAWALWYAWQPDVLVRPEQSFDGASYPPVPVESVRVMSSLAEPECLRFCMLARLHVRGRLFGPSDRAVMSALRKRAAALGANAIAPTTPSVNDLPVLGWLDKVFGDDIEADDRMRHNEEQVGRAIAVRCRAIAARP
jgi:hypothetical protein